LIGVADAKVIKKREYAKFSVILLFFSADFRSPSHHLLSCRGFMDLGQIRTIEPFVLSPSSVGCSSSFLWLLMLGGIFDPAGRHMGAGWAAYGCQRDSFWQPTSTGSN
jgi:hypothetical protein